MLLAGALALSACSADTSQNSSSTAPADQSAATGTTLAANWGGFPDSWAPGADMEPGYLRVPYENLVKLTRTGEIEPVLATEWELTDESLTLKLREAVTFHDGEAFNAEAVIANLEYIRDHPGPYSGLMDGVTAVEAVDEHTAKLSFDAPHPTILTALSTVGAPMASPAALADGSITTTPVGTGPWAYDQAASSTGTRMSFSHYDGYWGETPGFGTIELYGLADDAAAVAALQSGEIDLTDTEPDSLAKFEGTAIESLAYPAVRNNVVFFDRGAGGMFEAAEVRQAACYALDTSVMADLEDDMSVATQHLAEDEPGFNDQITGYTHDLDRAKQLYSSAGSPQLGAEMIAAPFNAKQIQVFADQISQLDEAVTISVQTAAPPQWASQWNTGRFPLGVGSHNELTAYDWYKAWFAADAPGNPSGVESQVLKSAADAAIAASGSAEADAKWAEVMKVISDEALACGHMVGDEILAWNSETVSGVQMPTRPWELNLVDYQALSPEGS